MNFSIRELKQEEKDVLNTFLYEAIFIPEGVTAPKKDIIYHDVCAIDTITLLSYYQKYSH